MTKQKAPKAQADALTWVKQSILEFGIAGLGLKELVAFLKTGLQSANGAVRSSATSTLVTLQLYIGTGKSAKETPTFATLAETLRKIRRYRIPGRP